MSRRTKGVPRGPDEWGEILYEPQWAKERWFEDTVDVLMGLSVAVLAIALILVVIDGIIRVRPPFDDLLLLIGICVFIAFTPLFFLGPEFRKMPFRVYEAGVTDPKVPIIQGARRQEELIPSDKVRRIDVHAISSLGIGSSHMEIFYIGPKGESSLDLTRNDVDDPLEVMLALHEILPDKLDEAAYGYMDTEGDDPVVGTPRSGETREMGVNWRFITFYFSGMVITSIIVGGMMGPLVISEPTALRLLVLMIIICVASTVEATITVRGARKTFYYMVGWRMHLDGDKVVYPIDPTLSMFIRARPFLPVDELVEVRKSLSEIVYVHRSRLRTLSDERIEAPIDIYLALRNDGGWERSGVVLRNKAPRRTPRGRLAEFDAWKGLGLFSLLTLIALLAGCLAFLLSEHDISSPVSFEQVHGYVMLVGMMIMGVLMLILIVTKTREARLVKTLFVSDKGISAPGSGVGLTWIETDEIRSCRIQETRWQREIHIETDRGTLRLPMAAYEKLVEGGVDVDDPQGIIPVRMDDTSTP